MKQSTHPPHPTPRCLLCPSPQRPSSPPSPTAVNPLAPLLHVLRPDPVGASSCDHARPTPSTRVWATASPVCFSGSDPICRRRRLDGRGRAAGVSGASRGGGAAAVPDEDVPAHGGPGDGRRDLVERGWVVVRRVAAGGVRAGPPPQALQAQQLLHLRAAAQHLWIWDFKDGAGPVGVWPRLLPARGEAPARRHTPPEVEIRWWRREQRRFRACTEAAAVAPEKFSV